MKAIFDIIVWIAIFFLKRSMHARIIIYVIDVSSEYLATYVVYKTTSALGYNANAFVIQTCLNLYIFTIYYITTPIFMIILLMEYEKHGRRYDGDMLTTLTHNHVYRLILLLMNFLALLVPNINMHMDSCFLQSFISLKVLFVRYFIVRENSLFSFFLSSNLTKI
ncbi:hypothetical protein ACJX0J_028947 [Zea mays]